MKHFKAKNNRFSVILHKSVENAQTAANKWKMLSQKKFISGFEFAFEAATLSVKIACANLNAVAASAPTGNLDTHTFKFRDVITDREKEIALQSAYKKQRSTYAAWESLAALASGAILYGPEIISVRNIAGKAFNRLRCRPSDWTGKQTIGARERELYHRRLSMNTHVFCPRPAPGHTIKLYLVKEKKLEIYPYKSYVFNEYSIRNLKEKNCAMPKAGFGYAFLRRWNPIDVVFETIIVLNENGSGLHYIMSGFSEYIVAAGEVVFNIRYLIDRTPIFLVGEVNLRSSRYLPPHEIRFCTGFPERAYRLFNDHDPKSVSDSAAIRENEMQYSAEYPQPEMPSERSSSRGLGLFGVGMLNGRGRRHSYSSSSVSSSVQFPNFSV